MLNKLRLKNIFLIDGVGAITTATSLGLVLPRILNWIGMPISVLYALAVCAIGFAVYSFSCHLFSASHKWLLNLIFLNLLYCLTTTILLVYFFNKLTVWGFTYFIAEIAIILGVVFIEREIYLKNKRHN